MLSWFKLPVSKILKLGPGNGIFAPLLVGYLLVSSWIIVVTLRAENTYLYNPHVWGAGRAGLKDFTLFYSVVSYIPFKYAFIIIFFWHLLDHSTDLRNRIMKSALAECFIYGCVLIWLFLLSRSFMWKFSVASAAIVFVAYSIYAFRVSLKKPSVSLYPIIFINSALSLAFLLILFPAV